MPLIKTNVRANQSVKFDENLIRLVQPGAFTAKPSIAKPKPAPLSTYVPQRKALMGRR